jgi:hypothetical protein
MRTTAAEFDRRSKADLALKGGAHVKLVFL